ncbi:WhiB family transcriptional regulator [Streptomyces scabiei]|uniref:WhiB family transcriptional regulator n=1 Tax=Streptomyces scabiei TaxID=1930 RepID=UPI0038F6FCE4
MTSVIPFLDQLPEGHSETPCRHYAALFVDSLRATPSREVVEEAKRLCAVCPVRPQCLEYALTHDEREGIWGGHTIDERREIARERATTTEDSPA